MEDTYNKLREMGYIEGATIIPAHLSIETVILPNNISFLINKRGIYAYNKKSKSYNDEDGWSMKLYDKHYGWAKVLSKENEYTIEQLEELTGIKNLKIKK